MNTIKSVISLPVLSITALTGLLLTETAVAQISDTQWNTLNTTIVNQHIVPGYQQLSHSAQQLQQQVDLFCRSKNEEQLKKSRQAFIETLNKWQAIQHVQFGPIETLMRNFSMQFWPDKKNLTGKQLGALLKAADPQSLSAEKMRAASIAVKGLPAMERLLFGKQALDAYKQNPFRCQLTQAVANNISTMATETHQEWLKYQQEFTQLDGDGYYETTIEATTDLLKAFVEPVEVIRDLKVRRPIGKSFEKAKPRRAESWRSSSSIENIQTNIASLHSFYTLGDEQSLAALLINRNQLVLADQIEAKFNTISALLSQLPATMAEALANETDYQRLQTLDKELTQLHKMLGKAMHALNIQLGFNSRDGD